MSRELDSRKFRVRSDFFARGGDRALRIWPPISLFPVSNRTPLAKVAGFADTFSTLASTGLEVPCATSQPAKTRERRNTVRLGNCLVSIVGNPRSPLHHAEWDGYYGAESYRAFKSGVLWCRVHCTVTLPEGLPGLLESSGWATGVYSMWATMLQRPLRNWYAARPVKTEGYGSNETNDAVYCWNLRHSDNRLC